MMPAMKIVLTLIAAALLAGCTKTIQEARGPADHVIVAGR